MYVDQALLPELIGQRSQPPLTPYRERTTIWRQSGGGLAASVVIGDQLVIGKLVAGVLSPTSVAAAHIRASRHVDPIEGWLS